MKVGVIGAGTMGSGIAQAFAQTEGYEVYLCDINDEFAANGKKKIAKGFEKRVARGKMDQAKADAILAKITTGTKDICTDADLVVEAALEVMEVKQQTFKELQDIVPATCMFATNTSSLSITQIGAGLDRPVIGMHFFNPAPVMKLIEVIAGLNTPDEMVEKIKAISVEIGKTPVQVEEAAGFVVNRILIPMINEAVGIYADGVASVEGIDTAMKLGANHPMGPLALGDLVGLEVNMRAPGAYMPDIINYTYDVDVYSIWADMLIHDKSFVDIDRKYSVGYVSRRDGVKYKNSIDYVKNKYNDKILVDVNVPKVLSEAMGDRVLLARSKDENDLFNIMNLVTEKI